MKDKISTTIPVSFEKLQDIDDRFMRFKIWIINVDAPNYNNSYFSKEAVLKALPTIYNTPVLGFIKEDRLGNKDFAGHEIELVIKDGELHEHYLGHAYGMIPQDCNPQFEFRENELGGLQEYLTVEAIVWTKFDDAVEILSKDGQRPQSMELSKKYSGKWREDGFFEFEEFQFFGCAILGEDVSPAIPASSIEKMFSKHNFQRELQEKMSEYAHLFEKHSVNPTEHTFKEVDSMNLEELLAKYSITSEDLTEKGINVEEFSIDELETKIQEVFTSNDPVEPEPEFTEPTEPVEPNNDPEPEAPIEPVDPEPEAEKFTINFELSHDDIRRQMWDKVDSHMTEKGFGNDWHYIVTVYDSNVIVENDMGNKFYKIGYTKESDVVSFGEVVEVHPMFLTAEEKGALELMRSNFSQLEKENKELKAFQVGVSKAQHEAEAEELFSQFGKLSDEDLAELRSDIHNFSIEQIESKLYELLGRKTTKFSRKEKEVVPKIQVKISEEKPKSSYSHIFAKHGLSE